MVLAAIVAVGAIMSILFAWHGGDAKFRHIEQFNGRIEANRLDVSSKHPGQVREVTVREGDQVGENNVIAQLDDAELLMQIIGAEATAARARSAIGHAAAELTVRQNAQRLARLDLQTAEAMHRKDMTSRGELERRQLAESSETAGVAAAEHSVSEAKAASAEADANVERLKLLRSEMRILAPTNGMVEFVFAQKGALIPAGGKIATLLQLSKLDMTIFLSAAALGSIRIGDEARVILDALPGTAIPAKVTYVASSAQFTPKHVETLDEREKLVFKVKLTLYEKSPEVTSSLVKPGMTGIAFLRTDASASWPASLSIPKSAI